jgi:hypothetical protein
MKVPVATAIAIAFGLVVLAGYFIPLPGLLTLRSILVQWSMIVASAALFVGVANLLRVHWFKIRKGGATSAYSFLLIASLVITLVVVGLFGPTGTWSLWIFNSIQLPIESSLMAILAVVLIYTAARLMRRRIDLFSLLFGGTVLLVLLGTAPILGIEIPFLYGPDGLRSLIVQIPAVAGARGILLGVALGSIATGLRILIGVDRPYGG